MPKPAQATFFAKQIVTKFDAYLSIFYAFFLFPSIITTLPFSRHAKRSCRTAASLVFIKEYHLSIGVRLTALWYIPCQLLEVYNFEARCSSSSYFVRYRTLPPGRIFLPVNMDIAVSIFQRSHYDSHRVSCY